MEWADAGIVLRVGTFREHDLWIRLFSQHRGISTVFAFGGSRSRRRFCGCLDMYNLLHVRVKTSGRGQYLALQEASLLRGPRLLRSDWRRMGMAVNCTRYIEALDVNAESAQPAFSLFDSLLQELEQQKPFLPLSLLFFRLRFACIAGFAPDFSFCASCGAALKQGACFFVDEGRSYCNTCMIRAEKSYVRGAYAVQLSASSLDVLRNVQQEELSRWHAFSIRRQEQRECARAIDGFVQYHMGLAWDEGRFKRV